MRIPATECTRAHARHSLRSCRRSISSATDCRLRRSQRSWSPSAFARCIAPSTSAFWRSDVAVDQIGDDPLAVGRELVFALRESARRQLGDERWRTTAGTWSATYASQPGALA